MRKSVVLLVGLFIIASLLGWFGQDIAYFLNERIPTKSPLIYLSVTTILSFSLYMTVGVVVFTLYRNRLVRNKAAAFLLLPATAIAFFVTFSSIFIFFMWWE